MAQVEFIKNDRQETRRRRLVLAAAKRLVAANKVTECAMEPAFGYRGPVCPVVNCYARDQNTGGCLANEAKAAKSSSKSMRDAMIVVEVINATREAPDWAAYTVPTTTAHAVYDRFTREANIDRGKLQYVLDNNPVYSTTLAALLKGQR